MDVLSLDGKNYIKANVIARELGYTADYVGQLCRSGKIDAQLIGRSWYVYKDSIRDHKNTRYRSTKVKTVQELRNNIRVEESQPVKISHFYTNHHKRKAVSYSPDNTELIPSVDRLSKKSGTLDIKLADAKDLSIDSQDKGYRITTPKLPKIKFHGSVKVIDYDADAANAATADSGKNVSAEHPLAGHVVHPKEVNKLKSENIANKIAISPIQIRADQNETKADEQQDRQPPSFTSRLLFENDEQRQEEDSFLSDAINSAEEKSTFLFTFSVLVLAILLAIVCSASILSIQTTVSYIDNALTTSYTLNMQQLFSILHAFLQNNFH